MARSGLKTSHDANNKVDSLEEAVAAHDRNGENQQGEFIDGRASADRSAEQSSSAVPNVEGRSSEGVDEPATNDDVIVRKKKKKKDLSTFEPS